MSHPAIKVEGLWKEYVVGHARERHDTFYELLSSTIKAPLNRLRSLGGQAEDTERFLALQDINFEVQPGEVVGIIGRNGAGKSTLLKILSRITAPTQGRIEVRGRLASLLEVGTGFHPELSGRENIFLNGAILGMTRKEVARKFDEIVAFAEIEKFIDTPVKRYSSGMYVRLAFAVAAHLDVDVLLVDEVLAVGDAAFQEKCLSKMGAISHGGRTVLFVSHNQGAIARLCNRGIVMSAGGLLFDGQINDAQAAYSLESRSLGTKGAKVEGPLKDVISVEALTINENEPAGEVAVSPRQKIKLKSTTNVLSKINGLRFRFGLWKQGMLVFSVYDGQGASDALANSTIVSSATIPAYLLSPGEYRVDVTAFSERSGAWIKVCDIAKFSVTTEWDAQYQPDESMGVVNMPIVGSRETCRF